MLEISTPKWHQKNGAKRVLLDFHVINHFTFVNETQKVTGPLQAQTYISTLCILTYYTRKCI